MTRPRTHKTEAVVLRQMPLGEADRILTLYTPDLGKVRAVAKGIRRMTSRLGGHLELLNRASISLAEGRDLDIVTEAQDLQSFRGFREDLEPLSRALYVAELVDAFSTERSPNHAMYEMLVDGLGWLETTGNADLLLRHMEMRVLEHSGFRPELYRCVECRMTLEPGDHAFASALGGALCPRCYATFGEATVPLPLNCMKVLRFLQQRDDFSDVEGLKLSPRLRADLERLLRTYIRFIVERELRSAEFLHRVSTTGQRRGPP